MKRAAIVAIRFTFLTTALFGLVYPLGITFLAKVLFPREADGSLIRKGGAVVGSALIGQGFSTDGYFHSRPSSAGAGYDASASSGSNLAPTNRRLIDRVRSEVQKLQSEHPGTAIPVDLVTASGSGLDPDISVAGAEFQLDRVARVRKVEPGTIELLVRKHTKPRQFGIFGESRVNVLELNLELDERFGAPGPAVSLNLPADEPVAPWGAGTDTPPRAR